MANKDASRIASRNQAFALDAKKKMRKKQSSEEPKREISDEENVNDAVKLPPLPSEIRNFKLSDEDMPNSFDLLMGNSRFDSETQLIESQLNENKLKGSNDGKSLVKRKKYSFDLDFELPVESENRGNIEKKEKSQKFQADESVQLPDMKELRKKIVQKKAEVESRPLISKIERGDILSFTKLLELDPEADSDANLFNKEEYDFFSAALGEGFKPFLGLPNPFLQAGHTVLMGLCFLCGFVAYPGFPLTELPFDIRQFLQTGLAVTFSINFLLAPVAFIRARKVRQPPLFWALKTVVLGGLAYNELSQIAVTERNAN